MEICGSKLKKVLKPLPHIKADMKFIRQNEDVYVGTEVEGKEKILKYLTSFYPKVATMARVMDHVKKEEVKELCDLGYYDGVFVWDETDIYHFREYNMPLMEEFLEFIKQLT